MFATRTKTAGIIGAVLPLCTLLLTACEAPVLDREPPKLSKIRIERVEYVHLVEFPPSGAGLSDAQKAKVGAFMARSGAQLGDLVELELPLEGAADQVGLARYRELEAYLRDLGLEVRGRRSAEAVPQGVRIFRDRILPTTPDCPGWRKMQGADFSNITSSNLGCATSGNLAVMLADPRDLLKGRDAGPADGERQALPVRNYREGKGASDGGEEGKASPVAIGGGSGEK